MNIKHFREFYHLSQSELASKVGVSKNTVSSWENGSNIRSDHLVSLCNVFECMPEDILSGLWCEQDFDQDQIDVNEFMLHEEELYNMDLLNFEPLSCID